MPQTRRATAFACGCIAASLFLFSSCTVSQNVAIKADGSGTLAMHAEVSKLLHDYMASLAEVSGKNDTMKDGKLFDAAGIRKDFEKRPGISVKKVSVPTADSLDLELAFSSIDAVFSGDKTLKGSGVLTYTESGGKKTVRLHLDRTNYTQLSALFPLLSDPTVSGLGPQVNDKVSDDEYLEMIRFSIGDDGPALVKKSFITLTIDPEGTIVSQTGGTIKGDAVVFRIPLLRLLVLDKPLDYSVTFT